MPLRFPRRPRVLSRGPSPAPPHLPGRPTYIYPGVLRLRPDHAATIDALLPSFVYSASSSSSSSSSPAGAASSAAPATCAVCLEEFRQNDLLRAPACGHALHSACLLAWLAKTPFGTAKCCLCQMVVATSDDADDEPGCCNGHHSDRETTDRPREEGEQREEGLGRRQGQVQGHGQGHWQEQETNGAGLKVIDGGSRAGGHRGMKTGMKGVVDVIAVRKRRVWRGYGGGGNGSGGGDGGSCGGGRAVDEGDEVELVLLPGPENAGGRDECYQTICAASDDGVNEDARVKRYDYIQHDYARFAGLRKDRER